jgi:hypothetical protein
MRPLRAKVLRIEELPMTLDRKPRFFRAEMPGTESSQIAE